MEPLNLADMLTFADIGQLNRIADHYACECKPNSKHELIQGILSKLGGRDFFEQQVQELHAADRRFLNSLLFDERPYLSMEELLATARQAIGDAEESAEQTPRAVVSRLRNSGWLFNGSTHNTRYLYQMPEDLKKRLRHTISKSMRAAVTSLPPPQAYRDEGHLLAEDLRLMLRFVDGHEITLNAEGVMYRRSQQQLIEHMHIAEQLTVKGGWRFGYGRSFRHYPDRLALLLDYALHRRLIQERNGLLILTDAGRETLDIPLEDSMIQLFRFWLRLYKGAIPNLFSLVYWICTCTEQWISSQELYEQVQGYIKPFYYDTAEDIFTRRLLRMMMHLGMLRSTDQEQGAIQMTAWGREAVRSYGIELC